MTSALQKAHLIGGLIIFGACSSITMKMQLVMMCTGALDTVHTFDKPFFQSTAMFFAMMFSLLVDFIFGKIKQRKNPKNNAKQESAESAAKKEETENTPLITDSNGSIQDLSKIEGVEQQPQHKKHKNPIVIAVPAIFDLVASTMMSFGLIYINVSIFQMLRGSMVIFTTILSRIFLKGRRVRRYQLIGVIIAVIGITVVGIAGVLVPQANQSLGLGKTIFGISLVLIAQVIQGAQTVVEEYLLADLDTPPMRVVGFEGVWGFLIMVFIACPLAYLIPGSDYSPMPHNSLENTYDTFVCLGSNGNLIAVVVVYCVAILLLNIYGMCITDEFNAINRTIFEAIRTGGVWAVNLIIHAIFPDSPFGEYWCKWSYIELLGFVILIFSTLIYNKVIVIPINGLEYDKDEAQEGGNASEENGEAVKEEEPVATI